MSDKIAIVGVGMTTLEDRKRESLYDMVFEASRLALIDAGMDREALESVVLASSDLIDGISISSMLTASAAGGYLKEEIRLADDGIFGLALAYLRIASGQFSNSIVVSWSKCSQSSVVDITNLNFEAFYDRSFALNIITASSLQANCYIYKYDVTESEAYDVVVKNRKSAMDNPLACLRQEVTAEEIHASRILASPIKALTMSCFCDGACALVLANEETAKALSGSPIWIRGLGWSADSYYIGDRELSDLTSLRNACLTAYRQAGISRPSSEIDISEIYELTPYHEMMCLEALGFCKNGEAGHFINDTNMSINPSGGLISSNPYFASGLIRVAEGTLQLRGRAGGRQVNNAKVALAHGVSGLCYQKNCVTILGS